MRWAWLCANRVLEEGTAAKEAGTVPCVTAAVTAWWLPTGACSCSHLGYVVCGAVLVKQHQALSATYKARGKKRKQQSSSTGFDSGACSSPSISNSTPPTDCTVARLLSPIVLAAQPAPILAD